MAPNRQTRRQLHIHSAPAHIYTACCCLTELSTCVDSDVVQLFACSGLKKKYRLVLTEELPAQSILDPSLPSGRHTDSQSDASPASAFSPFNPSPLYMFLLHAPKDVLMARISARKGHYFPPELLQSQLDTLEWPGKDEDVMVVDVSMAKEEIVEVLVTAIVKQHKGGEIGSHLHSLVTENNVRDVLKESVPVNPFTSSL